MCRKARPLLTADSLGPIPLKGTTKLAELLRLCPDWYFGWQFLDGSAEPVLMMRLDDVPVLIELTGREPASLLYRVEIHSRNARTADGIGPGVDARAVTQRWSPAKFFWGETGFFMMSESRPWMSLTIDLGEIDDFALEEKVINSRDWRLLPKGTTIRSVLLLPNQ